MAQKISTKYQYLLLIALVIFLATLGLPVILAALGFTIIDTAFTLTTWVQSVIVFFGAFTGVIAMKIACKKARD
ncbi:MAG: hypothetical protein ACFFAL_01275 [Promethearchaeota archaeon]